MASNTYSLLDVVKIVGFRVGDLKDSVDTLVNPSPAILNIVECVNEAIRILSKVKGLPFHNSRHFFNTELPYSTGTVTVTNGDKTVVGAGTTFTAAMVGRAFGIDGTGVEYRIAEFTDTTHIDLDVEYAGLTQAAQAYKIVQDRYALPASFRDVNHAAYAGNSVRGAINILTPPEMDRQRYSQRTLPLTTGRPTYLTVYDRDENGNYMVELDPFPDGIYRIALRTENQPTRLTTDDEATTMPVDDENIDVLIRGAEACWRERNTPGAIKAWFDQYVTFLATFDNKTTDMRPQLVPDDVTRGYAQPSKLGMGAAGNLF